jgi:hypothetical protein
MRLSGKLRLDEGGYVWFRCPGCDDAHMIATGEGPGPRWAWNGDTERPVFTPSVLVRGVRSPSGADVMTPAELAEYEEIEKSGREAIFASRFGTCCHSFVGHSGAAPGQIHFLTDSRHPLAGMTVDLPDWPREATQP